MSDAITLSPLDVHFADFIVRIDRHPGNELWWGAALASCFAGRGHTCFNLAAVPDVALLTRAQRALPPSNPNGWRESLQRCDSVGTPGSYTPLVLDQAGRLYLHRCWRYEQQVASGILSRSCPVAADGMRLEEALDRYFPAEAGAADLQRAAARMALAHRFSVISGGPGTGKTATVARILALFLDMAADTPPKIMLAAPTGKAAMRLHQSVIHAAGRLVLSAEIATALPSAVTTLHRLLGVLPRGGGFRHHRGNPLDCDVLVVDEASMVDLQLMAALLEALRDDARLILLGDRNQLASVEAGAVLADICDGAERATIPVTQLTKSYRFGGDSGIAVLSRLINAGDSAMAAELLMSGQSPDVVWRQLPTGTAFEESFGAAVRDGYGCYAVAASPAEALAALDSFRVLSPLRAGTCGVENLNRLAAAALERKSEEQGFRPPVMINGNNYELGLFNGDTGVIMECNGAPAVWFENPEGGLRHFSTLRLPPTEPALALTVHKSQGSEFERVLLILPERMSDVLCRELLYTAVTRARISLEIWGTEDVLRQTIERSTLRTSGLVERLAAGDGNA